METYQILLFLNIDEIVLLNFIHEIFAHVKHNETVIFNWNYNYFPISLVRLRNNEGWTIKSG